MQCADNKRFDEFLFPQFGIVQSSHGAILQYHISTEMKNK